MWCLPLHKQQGPARASACLVKLLWVDVQHSSCCRLLAVAANSLQQAPAQTAGALAGPRCLRRGRHHILQRLLCCSLTQSSQVGVPCLLSTAVGLMAGISRCCLPVCRAAA